MCSMLFRSLTSDLTLKENFRWSTHTVMQSTVCTHNAGKKKLSKYFNHCVL